MAGSTFQPPIHLDPNQDAPQQTAFINQNFQTIASTLETNSLRVVDRGTAYLAPGASTNTWTTVAHNLGFKPIVLAFLDGITLTLGSTVITTDGSFPLPTVAGFSLDTVNHVVNTSLLFQALADATNVYFLAANATATTYTSFPIKYYLLQQPAS